MNWRIEYLADQPHALETLAGWHHAEWSYLNPQRTLAERITRLQGNLQRGAVPTTFVALVLPLVLLSGFAGAGALRLAGAAAALGLALLMVSPVKIRKPGGAWYAFFLALAAATAGVYAAFASRFPA